MQDSPLRLGVLGAARIAVGHVIPAASEAEGVRLTAVATRNGGKASKVREVVPETVLFENYGALLESPNVDAVYIPLPNSMHVEWTLKALAAGKHVLCEKPFAMSADLAEKAVEAAASAGLTLMEGFMYRLHPQIPRLKELLDSGAFGDVKQVLAQFGHRLDDPNDVRGMASLGGGSLGDVGCYCVSAARLAFGAEPRRVTAFARFDGEGADEELAGVLEFDGGLATISCSTTSARREHLEIVGTEGKVFLDAPFRADKAGGTMTVTRGGASETEPVGESAPYRAELEEFAAAVREDREPAVGPREILGNARAIEALLESARAGGEAREVRTD